jgi:cytochrome c oxidase subunit 2
LEVRLEVRRKKEEGRRKKDTVMNGRWAVVFGTLCAAAVASADGRQTGASAKVVHVVAERFAFVPSEITVEQGTVLELRLTSEDTIHGFRLTGPGQTGDIDVAIPKRGRGDVRVRFEAAEAGRYVFECSRLCGAGHSFMRGTVRVLPHTTQPSGGP